MVDLVLLSLFGLQHTIMARPAFKQWWTRFVPRPVERSTFVLFASLALLLFWQWLPLPETVWNLSNPFVRFLALVLYGAGWLIVLLSSFLIDHGDLLGMPSGLYVLAGQELYRPHLQEAGTVPSGTPPLVRHPMMVGFLLAFWATPHMTVGHLLFSLAMAGYIFAGIHFEERDLLAYYGEAYERYRRRVRMLLPFPKRRSVSHENGQPHLTAEIACGSIGLQERLR